MFGCVLQVLQMIPENNHVGLITFGTHVHVHELGYAECSKAFVFRGSKEYSSSQVRLRGMQQTSFTTAAAAAQGLRLFAGVALLLGDLR